MSRQEMRQGTLRSGLIYLRLDPETYRELSFLCQLDRRDIRDEAVVLLEEAINHRHVHVPPEFEEKK